MPTSDSTIMICESADHAEFSRIATLGDDVLATEVSAKEALTAGWNAIVDRKLIEWGSTRNEFEIDGLVGPTNEAIGTAFKLVRHMRKYCWPLPTGVIPDGEGGIVFENRHDPLYQRIEIDKDGRATLATFHDCQLMERVPIDIE